MEYYKVIIEETARYNLKSKEEKFNWINQQFASLDGVRQWLKERYGKLPSTKNKVYVDKDNGESEEIGFTYSYWNNDISHNTKKWFQTDWITITKVKEEVVLLNGR